MKIAIVGAGIIGVTTAFELAADGHSVSVFERRGATAEEASFAPAGIISPGYVRAWPAPGIPGGIKQFLLQKPDAYDEGSLWSKGNFGWAAKRGRLLRASRNLPFDSYASQLAQYSRDRLAFLTAELKLEYDRSAGYTVLLKSERDQKAALPKLEMLKESGVAAELLNPAQTRAIETALNPDAEFYGAIHFPNDMAANTRQIALLLRAEAQRLGASFEFNASASVDAKHGTNIALAISSNGATRQEVFDAVVFCTGSHANASLKQAGTSLPMMEVHALSVSATIREPLNAPRSALLDKRSQTSIVRLGNRVRVCAGGHAGQYREAARKATLLSMYRVLQEWFPGAAHMSAGVQEWGGAYATTIDGLPAVGPSGTANVWLNLAHGPSGGMNAFGSARMLADMIASHPAHDSAAPDPARLSPARFAT